MAKRAIVIGAGIGGIAAAALLGAKGYSVDLFEQNGTPGGKMQQWESQGYRFDTGPSLLTMPFILEKLFESCGQNLSDYLSLSEPEPLCRYFYKDGVIFDNYGDRSKTMQEIQKFAPEDEESYAEFLDYSKTLYNKTADAFLFNPLNQPTDLKSLNWLDLLTIDAFSTVSDKVDGHFSSPYLRKFFKRFTTYNGSSPFQAPATLNVIPHVELNQGGYYVKGGLYSIAIALEKLAKEMRVNFHYHKKVTSLKTVDDKLTSIKTMDGHTVEADLVVANSDATNTLLNLLSPGAISKRKRAKQRKLEPSCSGFVLMLGCNKAWPQLKHHNIFFSEDYELEFEQIFSSKTLPDDPTIYVANTSYTDSNHAPKNSSNLFILVNSPYVTDEQDWDKLSNSYRNHIIHELEKRGLDGLKASIETENVITPIDFLKRYGSNRGSIYGTSSNSKFAAFVRPRNKVNELENLYLVGGSTHPGGGIPLVVQSAFNALELIGRSE